jgi:hypothetical protein
LVQAVREPKALSLLSGGLFEAVNAMLRGRCTNLGILKQAATPRKLARRVKRVKVAKRALIGSP